MTTLGHGGSHPRCLSATSVGLQIVALRALRVPDTTVRPWPGGLQANHCPADALAPFVAGFKTPSELLCNNGCTAANRNVEFRSGNDCTGLTALCRAVVRSRLIRTPQDRVVAHPATRPSSSGDHDGSHRAPSNLHSAPWQTPRPTDSGEPRPGAATYRLTRRSNPSAAGSLRRVGRTAPAPERVSDLEYRKFPEAETAPTTSLDPCRVLGKLRLCERELQLSMQAHETSVPCSDRQARIGHHNILPSLN
jgi:hypothetical protein